MEKDKKIYGEWIKGHTLTINPNTYMCLINIYCSTCHESVDIPLFGILPKKCPNCNAEMSDRFKNRPRTTENW